VRVHSVYKYVYDSEIIYIGKCDRDLRARLSAHGTKNDNIPPKWRDEINNSDIYYFELPNRIMTDVVESELIRRYKPKCNRAKKSEWGGIEFKEPTWKKFRENGVIVYDLPDSIDGQCYISACDVFLGMRKVYENIKNEERRRLEQKQLRSQKIMSRDERLEEGIRRATHLLDWWCKNNIEEETVDYDT